MALQGSSCQGAGSLCGPSHPLLPCLATESLLLHPRHRPLHLTGCLQTWKIGTSKTELPRLFYTISCCPSCVTDEKLTHTGRSAALSFLVVDATCIPGLFLHVQCQPWGSCQRLSVLCPAITFSDCDLAAFLRSQWPPPISREHPHFNPLTI